jgi:hypothetical protein
MGKLSSRMIARPWHCYECSSYRGVCWNASNRAVELEGLLPEVEYGAGNNIRS